MEGAIEAKNMKSSSVFIAAQFENSISGSEKDGPPIGGPSCCERMR
jgi:hypothetical protein